MKDNSKQVWIFCEGWTEIMLFFGIYKTYFEAILESLWRNDDTDKCKALHVYTGTKFNFFVKWIF